MPEYTVRFEKAYIAWVLYECGPEELLFQQVAANWELSKDQVKEAEAWANSMIHSWGHNAFVTIRES